MSDLEKYNILCLELISGYQNLKELLETTKPFSNGAMIKDWLFTNMKSFLKQHIEYNIEYQKLDPNLEIKLFKPNFIEINFNIAEIENQPILDSIQSIYKSQNKFHLFI